MAPAPNPIRPPAGAEIPRTDTVAVIFVGAGFKPVPTSIPTVMYLSSQVCGTVASSAIALGRVWAGASGGSGYRLVRPRGPAPSWVRNTTPYVDDPRIDQDIPKHQRRSLLDLDRNACRWPVGDPARSGFFFCGAQQLAGKPYCARHWARASAQASAGLMPDEPDSRARRTAQDR